VSKKEIFALAAKELRLTIQSERTTQIDDDMFITRLGIGNMLNKESCDRETREFLGNSAPTKNLSIENAYHTALKYLESENLVQIDDYNGQHVSQLRTDMLCCSTWLMLYEEKANQLKNDISAKNMALREFFSSFDSVCQQAAAVLPLFPPKEKASPNKKPRHDMVPSTSKTDPASVYCDLSKALTRLRAELLLLLGPSSHDVPVLAEQAESSVNRQDTSAPV
jgi:hypothetical protein